MKQGHAALISAKDLSYGTPRGRALAEGVSFELYPGECLLISGPNGAGKSTLLAVLLGLAKPLAGVLQTGLPRRQFGILPQLQNNEFHLPMTLRDVLEVSVGQRVRPAEVERIGLLESNQLSLAWNTASGGERKRTLLTMLLLQSPSVLLLDEPMNHLDQLSREKVLDAILKFLADGKRALVMVSHESALQGRVHGLKRLTLGSDGEEETETEV